MRSCTRHPGLCVLEDGHEPPCVDPSGNGWPGDENG